MHCITCKKKINNSFIYMAYDKSHCSEKCRDNTIRIYGKKNKYDYLYYYMNYNINDECDYLYGINCKKHINIEDSNKYNELKNCTIDNILIYIKNLFF